jgi:hypothetical protein
MWSTVGDLEHRFMIVAMVPEAEGSTAATALHLAGNRVSGGVDHRWADEPSHAWADAA